MADPSNTAAEQGSTTYRVGDLLIETGRQRVMRAEQVVAVTGLSYDLLLVLIAAAPNLVANDDLMAKVWPKTIVSPETLSQRIKLLRDALGDDPRKPMYVEGLRGRGYRLIPSVERLTAVSAEPAAPQVPALAEPVVEPPLSGVASSPAVVAPSPAPSRWRSSGTITALILLAVATAAVLGLSKLKHGESPAQRTSVNVVPVQPRAVAVLPFENLSAEPGSQYIALGIAESVLNRLGSIHELIVIARSSSFSLGNSHPDAQEIGRKLGVEYLVEGSVQRAGTKLRVNAQLVDAVHNSEMWSLSFDRNIDDVFAVQDEIALRVAQKLEVSLNKATSEYSKFGTEAYLAFLQGRALLDSRKIPDIEAAIRQFSKALELAPTFAPAMTDLAYAKLQLASVRNDFQKNIATLLPEIRSLVNRAIELDPSAGSSYYLRAQMQLDSGQGVKEAEADFRKGFELAPNYALGVYNYGSFLDQQMRYDEALALLDRASVLDPMAASIHYLRGEILRIDYGHLDEAAAAFRQALTVDPDYYPAYTRYATLVFNQGKLAEAIKLAEKSVAIEPNTTWTRMRLVWLYVHASDLDAARDAQRGFVAGGSGSQFSEALVCYRAGKLELAERITRRALKDPDLDTGVVSVALAEEAVVESALKRGDPTAARTFLLGLPGLKMDKGSIAIVDDNWPTFIALAAVEQQAGNAREATALAQSILNFADHDASPGPPGLNDWTRASALAILGRNDEAMAALESMALTGNYLRWWVTLESDPSFSKLHGTARFQAFAANTRAWLATQQGLLRELRERGEVPKRFAAATAGGC
jgi:TolB-like protein/DNA-binding winged helix-turn-helix (wHTH) protein/Tfp pilus assembly protein PilF